ncbi:hypothetical protein Aspvir_001171 [Aspergillus viridinutans]|uniref:Uncharacterized protein n=1 Tax=Aspergillus viridinutans TaxID=75553 RepID=A0A9P3BME7_ASPVI|nr:uncharacterized protein Aspvir_001171 [Aspergillus viridinutans]GIJ99047.1 hypothetical protein Aspvir_001171 [Aspergillus viridinutans]
MTSKAPAAFQEHQARKRLDQFAADLETSINHAIKFSPYRKTAVIAFHWENDDIGVEPLERELLDVFKSVYGFETESFSIPLYESQFKLLERLVSWSRRNAGDDTLRIYVYSGHASSAGTVASRWYLSGRYDPITRNLVGPQLDWWNIRSYLEHYTGDICYLFDCCSAGSGALGAYDGAEFIAASVWDAAATANTHFSFTRILIDELRQLNGQAETLACIYALIFRNAQQNQIGAPPIHIPKLNSPSVTIGRNRSRPAATRSSERDSYRVLLSVKVRDEIPPDPTQWKEWLTRNIPASVLSAKVTIEGAFRGSSLLLFTVPVEIWTMMPANDPSYTFIGHVKSHIILSQQLTQTTTLPMRFPPLSGGENQPPRGPDRKSLGSPGPAPPRW